MKKVVNIIISLAWIAFIVSVCTIESLSIFSLVGLLVSGSILGGYAFWCEEERRAREGR